MEIIYWKSPISNFGDELNATYWNKVITQPIHEKKSDEALLGIGSILHFRIEKNYKKIHILGTGTSQVDIANVEKDKYKFWFVRGPLTANLLGLDKKLAISDPAVLVPDLYKVQLSETKRGGIYIPHYASALSGGVDVACQLAGLRYVSPMAPLDSIAHAISSAQFVVTESLHGAILADAYRVPWIPTASPFISRAAFKWHDWCQSLGLSYKPVLLPSLATADISLPKMYGNLLRKNMATLGLGPKRWLDKQTRIDGDFEIEAYSQSILCAVNSPPNLSTLNVINEVKERMYSVFRDFSGYISENN